MADFCEESMLTELLALLDLIETKKDWELVSLRFEIMRKYGEVTFGEEASGAIH